MEVQQGEGKPRRTRLGANRLMTYKESNDIPEYMLRKELVRLESNRQRVETQYKREEEALENLLFEILDSWGSYVNLDTRQSVHEELRREILKSIVSSKRQEPVLPPVFNDEKQDDDSPKVETEAMKKVRRTQKLKEKKKRAMRPTKPRPSYKAVLEAERTDRRQINNSSFIELLRFYGHEEEPHKINLWMDILYPNTRLHSATICGIKKRLERYKNRLLMESDPKDNGIEWFFTESKVGNRYPEVLKMPKPKVRFPPINGNGSLTSQSDSSSQGSVSNQKNSRESGRSTAQLRKEPISASEFLFGTRPRSSQSVSDATIDQVQSAQSEGYSEQDGSNKRDKPREKEHKPQYKDNDKQSDKNSDKQQEKEPRDQRGILKRDDSRSLVKKVSIIAPPDLDELDFDREKFKFFDEPGWSDGSSGHAETREEADRRRRTELDIATLEKRKKSLTKKEVNETTPQRIEQLKAEVAKVMKLKAEGREAEIDYDNYFQRRRSLAMLIDDEELDFMTDEEFKRNWEDVQKCKYIRGYDPPEMRGTDEERIGEFVFWKGDFEREETFVRERNAKGEDGQKQEEVTAERRPSRRKSLAEVGRRTSVIAMASSDGSDAKKTRKTSVVAKV